MAKMPRRQFMFVMAGSLGSAGAAGIWLHSAQRTEPLQKSFQKTSWALGSDVSLNVFHCDEAHAERAMSAAFQEFELIEQLMSLYRPESSLCRLNRDGILRRPHPYLIELLTTARTMSEQTHGAFDITVQPLWTLYADAKQAGRLPTQAEVDAARELVDWRKVEFDSTSIRLAAPGMAVTLNGVAQGFAADRVAKILREHGIEHALIDAGELGSVGTKPDGSDWTIGIQHPRLADSFLSVAKLGGRCLSTSGDYETKFSEDFRHHHLFDPRTGRSPTDFSSVSIAAATALEADVLSTAVFVLGADAGLKLVQDTPHADALLVLKDGRIHQTPGFPLS